MRETRGGQSMSHGAGRWGSFCSQDLQSDTFVKIMNQLGMITGVYGCNACHRV